MYVCVHCRDVCTYVSMYGCMCVSVNECRCDVGIERGLNTCENVLLSNNVLFVGYALIAIVLKLYFSLDLKSLCMHHLLKGNSTTLSVVVVFFYHISKIIQ